MAGVEDVTPHVEIEGADEAAEAFRKIGEAGEQAFNKIEDAAASVGNASEGIKQLADGGAEAFKHLSEAGAEAFSKILDAAMGGNFTGIITHMFGELAGAITEVSQKAVEFVEAQASMAETMSNLAEATGMTVAEIGGLRDAFASVGISTSGFERSIGRLSITIANEWSQIQQSVRTSADAQQSAMLQVAQAAFNVEKAYTAMGEALSSSSRTAAHDALAIQEAAIGLRRASQELSDFALTARQNSLSVESAQLALIRARMNLQKDQGYAVNPADEKALKIEQDKVAVKDAELRLDEAKNKKAKEGMEMEELTLKLKKAKMEMADAEAKQQQDAVKSSERIHQAQLDLQKSQVANRETQEKAHEQDLKDIPKIAREIENVADGHKRWADVMNHTEISAQNMTKALLLASSPAGGGEPKAMDVFKEMSKLFENMGDDADSMNKKLEIVQHTMGAGFRAGQASAAQLLAVLQRGPDALRRFMEEAEKFSKVKISGFDLTEAYAQLKEFNSASSQLSAALDQVKTRFAALMAVPLTEFFTQMKNSLLDDAGAMRTLVNVLGDILQVIVTVASGAMNAIRGIAEAINTFVQGIAHLTGMKPEVVFEGLGTAAILASGALRGIAQSIILIVGRLAFLGAGVGAVIQALGALYATYLLLTKGATTWAQANDNAVSRAGKLITQSSLSMIGIDAKNTAVGLDDKQMKEMGVAAQKEEQAAEKMGSSADKHGTAADKHSSAADKLGSGGDKISDAGSAISSSLGGASDKLGGAAEALKAAAAAIVSAIANLGKPAGAKAGGGKISGPGGPTDDSAGLYALSDGEYVVKSAAVSHYGEGLFAALNNLSVGGFATGGMVGAGVRGASVPSSANGGGPSSILNLSIDGHQFNGLKAPAHVASQLKSYAVGRQSSSAGNKPSWMR